MSNQDFPSYPEESGRADQEGYRTSLEPPPSITTAVLLMRIGAAVSALSIIVGLLTLDSLKDEIRADLRADGSFTQSDLDAAFGVAVAFIIVVGLIGVALWLWMASANGKGKSWARILATIFGVINVVGFLFSLTAGTETAASLVLGAVSFGVGVAALVFMYRSDATAFYQAQKAPMSR